MSIKLASLRLRDVASPITVLIAAEYFSLMGIQIGLIVFSWTLLSSSGSPVLMTNAITIGLVLSGLISFPTGLVLDRMNQKIFLIIISGLRSLTALVISLLFLFQADLVFVSGLGVVAMLVFATQFTAARRAMLPGLVGPVEAELTKANSTINAAEPIIKFIVPVGVGWGMTIAPGYWLIVLQAILFFASGCIVYRGVSYCPIKTDHEDNSDGSLWDGVKIVFRSPLLRKVLFSGSLAATSITVLTVLILPVMAKDLENGSAVHFGALSSALGFGALFGVVISKQYLSRSKLRIPQKLRLVVLLLTVSFIMLALMQSYVQRLGVIFLIGVFTIIAMILIETSLQLITPPAMRGRVFTAFDTLLKLPVPVGMLIFGYLIETNNLSIPLTTMAVLVTVSFGLTLFKIPEKEI